MKISQEFPSKYLKADDLDGREVRGTIANVEREKMGDDFKPVVYFKGKEKGVVLNKTNSFTIATAYGDDTEEWFGNDIILFSVMTEYGGKTTPAIRCRIPTARDNKNMPAQRKPDPISSGQDFPGDRPVATADLNDTIDF